MLSALLPPPVLIYLEVHCAVCRSQCFQCLFCTIKQRHIATLACQGHLTWETRNRASDTVPCLPSSLPASTLPSISWVSLSPLSFTFLTQSVSPEAVTCSSLAPAHDARHRAGSRFWFPRVYVLIYEGQVGFHSCGFFFFLSSSSSPQAQITFSLHQHRGHCLANGPLCRSLSEECLPCD